MFLYCVALSGFGLFGPMGWKRLGICGQTDWNSPGSRRRRPSTGWPGLWRSAGRAAASGSCWRTSSGRSTQPGRRSSYCRWTWLWCRRTPAPRRPEWTSGAPTPCNGAGSWRSWNQPQNKFKNQRKKEEKRMRSQPGCNDSSNETRDSNIKIPRSK